MPETITARIGDFAALTRARGHAIVGDEPVSFGGEGLGPSPVELLQASLAHCAMVTMAAECRAHGVDLPPLEIRVTYTINVSAQGPNDPNQRRMRLTAMKLRVILAEHVDDAVLARMRHGAENCPVGNTLAAGLRLEHVFDVPAPIE